MPDVERDNERRDQLSWKYGPELLRAGQTQVRSMKSFKQKMVASHIHVYSDPLMARLIKKAGTSMVALGDIGDSLGNRVRPRCQGLVVPPLKHHPCSKPLVLLVIVVIVIAIIMVICALCSPRSRSNTPVFQPTSYYIRSSSSTPMLQNTSYTL